ncbi:hypothetical protein EDM22_12320 [Agromyces tardus]|uniref:Uncharacterized protein n=1 Tax=Agromyces tardus TaxID=2583849 RepID=A0A3M8A829_9MICO|nr:hypothetical protein [Agromyces tardus]RNB47409.1 hypothetical protein EDM22_12320 [Agromyces tardus]
MAGEYAVNIADLYVIQAQLSANGIALPKPIERGFELLEVIRAHQATPTGDLLSMTDEQARGRVDVLALRSHQGAHSSIGLKTGVELFHEQLLSEIREAMLPELDSIVEQLQPTFAELSKPLEVAARDFGFTWQTTSDQVIDMANEKASAAWRATGAAIGALSRIVKLRKAISTAFHVSPTLQEINDPFSLIMGGSGAHVDYSVCFAAGDNWSTTGNYYLHERIDGALNWLALAAGGLRLNTPAEVRAKLVKRRREGIPAIAVPSAEATWAG